jgi:small-conductance mechanosensitive channel
MWSALGLAQQAATDPKADACGSDPSTLCSRVFDITKSDHAAKIADALSKPVRLLLIVILAWLTTRLLRIVIRRVVRRLTSEEAQARLARARRRSRLDLLDKTAPVSVGRRAQRAATLGVGLRNVTTIVVWAVAFVLVLDTFDVAVAPLLAGAGFLGLTLGFGLQRLVQDFTSGVFMIVEDQFGVGDVIDVGDTAGTVEGLSLRVTQIRDVEGVLWHVPNGEVRRVANKSQRWSRAVLDIAVSYRNDVGQAKQVVTETARALYDDPAWKDSQIIAPPEMWGVEAFAADGFILRLVVKTKPLQQWDVARELRHRIKDAFDREGIEIPVAQREVVLHVDPPPDAEGPYRQPSDRPGPGRE